MPSFLDFDSTKGFRNVILEKTLTVENGPQSFTSGSYTMQKLSDMSNVDTGTVENQRPSELVRSQNSNTFKPIEYFVKEDFTTIPRKANLSLYPYFETGKYHSFVSIMTGEDYTNESEMMKFAAWNIENNKQGPFYGRLQSNLYAATAGKVRLLDALQGNTSTAINILTGREPMVEGNSKITVASTLVGKGIDFLQTVTGVEFPWSEIPGDYLTNPRNPVIARPEAKSEAGAIFQDVTGAIGSLFGIQRRQLSTKKPSDLFIEYMGQRQKATLYDNLSYLKYGPDYTTTARSQNTSKLFAFTDNLGESVRNLLGLEAPKLLAYIGDDRGNDVKKAMSDFNDRQVRSSYYLGMLFDPVQVNVFLRTKGITEGGGVGGRLTWISTNSKNKLGINNEEYRDEQSKLEESLSTNFAFRDDSILGITQQILDTLPSEGGASRSHVANVIDQTSRVFREDGQLMSRGSNIKYVDKFTGSESGVEYCRVWTKDRSYMNYSDTMKRQGNIRKFTGSVLDKPWNLNIYPNSNGNGGFDSSSTNMAKGKGDGFYAKKYMFSIENLAWKSSNSPGFTYNDLPYCERGSNGGRVMWFPPYGLKVTEQNQARWEENTFLGRPEPVYTYQNTSRHGTIQFKVIVDHPSILNLLVKDHFKDMSDEEADNYINAFFAGCEELDFYALIRQYTTLTEDDVTKILAYLNKNGDSTTIKKYKTIIRNQPNVPKPKNEVESVEFSSELFFKNDYPDPNSRNRTTESEYAKLYSDYISWKNDYLALFDKGFDKLQSLGWTPNAQNDYKALMGSLPSTVPQSSDYNELRLKCKESIISGFTELETNYNKFNENLEELKTSLSGKTVQNIKIKIQSRTSSVADDSYNLDLAYRRSYSMIKDVITKIAKTTENATEAISQVSWVSPKSDGKKESTEKPKPIKLKTLGYEGEGELSFDYVGNVGEQIPGDPGNGARNIDCSDKYKIVTSTELKQTAPITFYCRESTINIAFEKKAPDEIEEPIQPEQTIQITENIQPGQLPSPPIDEMKRIIMKTLSECYYFKKLEEDSPVQFSSMKEKLRYFHPSFHSMTPEGLNSRLTFLQQCIRPGDTIPIKGVSDDSDLNARNTTFGPPPICIMRVGDFYHSKIIIRDVNLEFEEDLWDLNPEGIGVQPMIANVTLQISFIGGHGLERPVERLQNALSSNFYANTEMYDPRSISTVSDINGSDLTTFRKEFLESLVENFNRNESTTSQSLPNDEQSIEEGTYIGTVNGIELTYDTLVDELYSKSVNYYKTYADIYNNSVRKYGSSLGSIILSPTYRTISNYIVEKGSGTETIELFGEYPKGKELEVLKRNFKSQILKKIEEENISNIFEFNKDLTPSVLQRTEDVLKPYVRRRISQILDEMPIYPVNKLEVARNEVIMALDKLNFIIETGHDGSIKKDVYTKVNFSGYTYDKLYNTYKNVISYISDSQSKFTEDLDTTSYVFDISTSMTTNDLSKFLSELLNADAEFINGLFTKDETIFTKRVQGDIAKRVDKFLTNIPIDKNFSKIITKNVPKRENNNPIKFGILSTTEDFTEDQKEKLKKIFTLSPNKTITELNYYR